MSASCSHSGLATKKPESEHNAPRINSERNSEQKSSSDFLNVTVAHPQREDVDRAVSDIVAAEAVYLSKITARKSSDSDSSPQHHVDVSLGQNTEMFQEMARRLWENRQHLEKITYGGKGDQQRTLDFSLSAQTETGFVKTIVGILQNGDSINVSLKMHPIDAVSNLVVQPALLMKDKNSNANDILVNGSKVVERHSSLVKSMEDIAQKAESDKTQTPEKLQNALNSAPFKAIFDDMRKQKHKLLHHDSIKAFLVAGESSWGFTKQEPAGQEDDSQSHKPYEQSGTVKIARRHIDTYNILNPEEFFKDRKNAVWLNFCAAFGAGNITEINLSSTTTGTTDSDSPVETQKGQQPANEVRMIINTKTEAAAVVDGNTT